MYEKKMPFDIDCGVKIAMEVIGDSVFPSINTVFYHSHKIFYYTLKLNLTKNALPSLMPQHTTVSSVLWTTRML